MNGIGEVRDRLLQAPRSVGLDPLLLLLSRNFERRSHIHLFVCVFVCVCVCVWERARERGREKERERACVRACAWAFVSTLNLSPALSPSGITASSLTGPYSGTLIVSEMWSPGLPCFGTSHSTCPNASSEHTQSAPTSGAPPPMPAFSLCVPARASRRLSFAGSSATAFSIASSARSTRPITCVCVCV